MKKLVVVVAIFGGLLGSLYAQQKKQKKAVPIEKITAILSPVHGKADELDASYSRELFDKYGIKEFEFRKMNALDGSDCTFTYQDGQEPFPQSLNVGDYYLARPIYNSDSSVRVEAQYARFIKNEKNVNASQAEVVYRIYKNK